MAFAAGFGLDAAADINGPGMKGTHSAIDVCRRQPAGDDHRIAAGHLLRLAPWPRSSGATDGVRRPGVEKGMVALIEPHSSELLPGLDSKRGQQEEAERTIGGGQRSVNLDRGQGACLRNGGDLLRWFIQKDANPRDRGRHISDQRLRLIDADLPLAAGEDESEQVNAQLDRELDVGTLRVPAHFDPGHRPLSSRTLASRSAARSSDSPTSAASTPSRSSSSMSARLSMPLSLITSQPGGISVRNRAVISWTVFIGVRSRLLMPMISERT